LIERLGLPFEPRSLHRDDLPRASELFLSGTSMEICPIVRVDQLSIGNGQPGPWTRQLQEAFRADVRAFLEAAV
jgi:D-alanine transaminase